MAEDNALGVHIRELVARREKAGQHGEAQPFVAHGERRVGTQEVGNGQGAIGFAVGETLPPRAKRFEPPQFEPGDRSADPFDRRVHAPGHPGEPRQDGHGHVVAAGERPRVAGVVVREDGDPNDRAEGVDVFLNSGGVERAEQPDVDRPTNRVARPLAELVGVGEPAESRTPRAVPAVDDGESLGVRAVVDGHRRVRGAPSDIPFLSPDNSRTMHVLVHGGAGSAPEEPEPRQAVLDEAASAGIDSKGPQAAVIAAVRRLESSPRFNAGTGSAVQSDGRVRTDAGLMTDDGESGAACSMPGVEHAVDVARRVKEETPHVLVAGEQAVALGAAHGVETGVDLWSQRSRETWAEATEDGEPGTDIQEQAEWIRDHFGKDGPVEDHDTVGAVATAGERLAAATSTGGRWFALAGRVGDVPQVGAGFYADETAAASATGEGEAIARFGLTRKAVETAGSEDPQATAERVIEDFADETGGKAGLILTTNEGATGQARNTEAMQTAGERRER